MSPPISSNPDDLFIADADLAKITQRKAMLNYTAGCAIDLNSKVLCLTKGCSSISDHPFVLAGCSDGSIWRIPLAWQQANSKTGQPATLTQRLSTKYTVNNQSNIRTGMTGHSLQPTAKPTPVSALTTFETSIPQLSSSNPNDKVCLIIAGYWDRCIRVFDERTGRLLACRQIHSDSIKSLLVLPFNTEPSTVNTSQSTPIALVISGCQDGSIAVSQLSLHFKPTAVQSDLAATTQTSNSPSDIQIDLNLLYLNRGIHKRSVEKMIQLPNGLLCSASSDTFIKILRLPNHNPSLLATSNGSSSLPSSNPSLLATPNGSSSLPTISTMGKLECLLTLSGHQTSVYDLCYVTSSSNATSQSSDLSEHKVVGSIESEVTVSLLSCSADKSVIQWHSPLLSCPSHLLPQTSRQAMVSTADNNSSNGMNHYLNFSYKTVISCAEHNASHNSRPTISNSTEKDGPQDWIRSMTLLPSSFHHNGISDTNDEVRLAIASGTDLLIYSMDTYMDASMESDNNVFSLERVINGHFDQVTSLLCLCTQNHDKNNSIESNSNSSMNPLNVIVSASLDGTIRRWSCNGNDNDLAFNPTDRITGASETIGISDSLDSNAVSSAIGSGSLTDEELAEFLETDTDEVEK